jgi:hypothetical protein
MPASASPRGGARSFSNPLRLVGAALIAAFCFSCSTPNRVVSEGSRVGVVVKFSLKEAAQAELGQTPPRSWEGELNMTIPGQAAPEVWLFSVNPGDAAAVEQVKAALRSRAPVELSYRQWLRVPTEPGGCVARPLQSTTYVVYQAAPLNQ